MLTLYARMRRIRHIENKVLYRQQIDVWRLGNESDEFVTRYYSTKIYKKIYI